jgi:hypothetical protein
MKTLQELLDLRFGDMGAIPETFADNEAIRRLAGRGAVRRFTPEPLPAAVLDTLAAVALSSLTGCGGSAPTSGRSLLGTKTVFCYGIWVGKRSFDHLVDNGEHARRNSEAEHAGDLGVDDQFELG